MALHHRLTLRATVGLALAALAGCQAPPVAWRDPVTLPAADTAAANAGQLALDASDHPTFAPPPHGAGHAPSVPNSCATSLRYATSGGNVWYAAWWAIRPDSSAVLWAARSDDGGVVWRAPVIADSTDGGVSGCDRAAPSIAASGDYVHIAYSMQAREGPGVFFTHSMDRGALFHSPVPVAYGERLGATDVAADGDRVVVAYEDPNGEASSVALAISATTGHIFERRVSVSGENGEAILPQVALHGNTIAVAWTERAGLEGTVRLAHMIRTGTLR